MARDWPRLALAALAAAALVLTGISSIEAQTAAKSSKKTPAAATGKKAPEQAPAEDEEEEPKPKAATRKKQDPAEAQRTIEAAGKLLEGGKSEQAAQSLTTVLSGGNLPAAAMAKAFLYRGLAYRQQQKPAQAISDLTSAMWLKGGLSPADRSNALQQRAAAFREAGLSESGEALVEALPQSKAATNTTTTTTSVVRAKEQPVATSSNWSTSTTKAAGTATEQTQSSQSTSTTTTTTATGGSGSQSGGGWNLFGGWFGGGASTQVAEAKPGPTTTTKSVTEPKASSWASGTEVRGSGPTNEIETASIGKPEGRFRVQLAMVRSQNEAEAVAARVKREYGAALASREPEIDHAVIGNMGSFYRVRIGPFATKRDGEAACSRLKGSGLDCLVDP